MEQDGHWERVSTTSNWSVTLMRKKKSEWWKHFHSPFQNRGRIEQSSGHVDDSYRWHRLIAPFSFLFLWLLRLKSNKCCGDEPVLIVGETQILQWLRREVEGLIGLVEYAWGGFLVDSLVQWLIGGPILSWGWWMVFAVSWYEDTDRWKITISIRSCTINCWLIIKISDFDAGHLCHRRCDITQGQDAYFDWLVPITRLQQSSCLLVKEVKSDDSQVV